MSNTVVCTVVLGPSKTGLSLQYRLFDATGTYVAAAVTAGFERAATGTYLVPVVAPDGHQGGVDFLNLAGGAILASGDWNPRELENADVKTSSLPSAAAIAAAVWAAATRTLSSFGTLAGDVWDVLTSGHQTANTTGKALTSAGLAGDPLSAVVPGSYPAGSAGYDIGTFLDAAVSSRASAGTVNITVFSPVATNGDITVVAGDDYGPSPTHLHRITLTLPGGQFPDLSQAGSSTAIVVPGLMGSPFTGVIVSGSPTADQVLALDTSTAGWVPNNYAYEWTVTAGGKRQTVRRGLLTVQPAG